MKKLYSLFKISLLCLAWLFSPVHKAQLVTQTFTYTGSIQTFTIPMLCVSTITIQAKGAQGGTHSLSTISSGLGADISGVVTVTPGQVLKILVGQQPNPPDGNGGGGGTFVTDINNNPIMIAGGGGGGSQGTIDSPNKHGQAGTSGGQGSGGGGAGGTNGNGGSIGSTFASGAGGGLLTNGATGWTANTGGIAFVNGGFPTTQAAIGGFGGGGSGSAYVVGAGGGGYSGGGAGSNALGAGPGGGGGSFNGGTSQVNIAGVNTGHGQVILSYVLGTPITATATPPFTCSGNQVNINAGGMVTYTWLPVGNFPGSNAQNIADNPTTTTQYTVQGTNSQGCISTQVITVTVNGAAPVLSINQSTPNTCFGNTVSLTASGAITYTWTGGVTNGVAFAPSATSSYTVTGTNGCGVSTATTSVGISNLPVLSAASPTLVCAAKVSTLTASGAATYTWEPGTLTGSAVAVAPSATTIYTVTGAAGPCSYSHAVTVSVNPNPTITTSAPTTTICEGDAITLSANGGLSYTWQPGGQGQNITISPTVSASYQVTGDNQFGCTSTAVQIVLVTAKPNITVGTNKSLICVGASATLNASGTHQFTWLPSGTGTVIAVSPVANTIYTAVGTNTTTQCSASKTIGINVFTLGLSVSPATSVCAGGTVIISAFGANTYTWNTTDNTPAISVSPATSTVYNVSATTVTLGMNCPVSNSVQVTVHALPTVTAAATKTSICRQETVTVSAGGANTYSWSTFQTTPSFVFKPNANTTFTFVATGFDANGCNNTATATVKVNACTGIVEEGTNNNVSIFPNPNNGAFSVMFESKPVNTSIRVYNTTGQLIKNMPAENQQTNLTLDHEANGIYTVEVFQDGRPVSKTKVVKE